LLTPDQLTQLVDALEIAFPNAFVLSASAREQQGLSEWFDILSRETQGTHPTMEVDYEVYADGEALLGWLNATVTLQAEDEFDANAFLKDLAGNIQSHLQAQNAEVAHLKMTYSPDDGIAGEIASVNLVRNDNIPESGMSLDEPSTGGQLILNLRAETDPENLLNAVRASLDSVTAAVIGVIANLAAWFATGIFAPGQPSLLYAVIAGVSLWLLIGRAWSIPAVVGVAAVTGLLRAVI
jgi:hypothetical protein